LSGISERVSHGTRVNTWVRDAEAPRNGLNTELRLGDAQGADDVSKFLLNTGHVHVTKRRRQQRL
jgi:hypothetical protein